MAEDDRRDPEDRGDDRLDPVEQLLGDELLERERDTLGLPTTKRDERLAGVLRARVKLIDQVLEPLELLGVRAPLRMRGDDDRGEHRVREQPLDGRGRPLSEVQRRERDIGRRQPSVAIRRVRVAEVDDGLGVERLLADARLHEEPTEHPPARGLDVVLVAAPWLQPSRLPGEVRVLRPERVAVDVPVRLGELDQLVEVEVRGRVGEQLVDLVVDELVAVVRLLGHAERWLGDVLGAVPDRNVQVGRRGVGRGAADCLDLARDRCVDVDHAPGRHVADPVDVDGGLLLVAVRRWGRRLSEPDAVRRRLAPRQEPREPGPLHLRTMSGSP